MCLNFVRSKKNVKYLIKFELLRAEVFLLSRGERTRSLAYFDEYFHLTISLYIWLKVFFLVVYRPPILTYNVPVLRFLFPASHLLECFVTLCRWKNLYLAICMLRAGSVRNTGSYSPTVVRERREWGRGIGVKRCWGVLNRHLSRARG